MWNCFIHVYMCRFIQLYCCYEKYVMCTEMDTNFKGSVVSVKHAKCTMWSNIVFCFCGIILL